MVLSSCLIDLPVRSLAGCRSLDAWSVCRCGHCKRLEPEYAKAAEPLQNEGITLVKVDATEEPNKALTEEFGVQGFPTMKVYLQSPLAAARECRSARHPRVSVFKSGCTLGTPQPTLHSTLLSHLQLLLADFQEQQQSKPC